MAAEVAAAKGKNGTAEGAAVPARKGPSLIAFLGAMLILTGFAVGMGGLLGMQVAARMAPAHEKKNGTAAGAAFQGRYAADAALKPLPSITTNLASPANVWVRLEASVVVQAGAEGDVNAMLAGIAEDFVAFLRTVSLGQIEGPSGFQNLREDLTDRLRVRTGGKARDLVIQAFIVE